MDCKCALVGKLDPDDLKQVPRPIRSDAEHLGWIGITVQIDDDDRVLHRVLEIRVVDAVSPGRSVDLNTRHIVIHNTAGCHRTITGSVRVIGVDRTLISCNC